MSNVASVSTLLGDVVAANPGAARILDAHGLDYCCGGRRSLAEACADRGVDPDQVLAELADVPAAPFDIDCTALSAAELCDHIVGIHHDYLWREMPRLTELTTKVTEVHGENHPELREVAQAWTQLTAELTEHLLREEQVEFPAIKRGTGSAAGRIGALQGEHDTAGAALVRLRELTSDYTVPGDACGSYRALYAGLAELEQDLHVHIHKENNILFPRLAG